MDDDILQQELQHAIHTIFSCLAVLMDDEVDDRDARVLAIQWLEGWIGKE